jgi:hypothetical protein
VRGGLGNQMFIAAAAFATSRRLDVPLVLDTSFLARKRQHQGDVDRLHLDARHTADAYRWLAAEPEQLRLLGAPLLRSLGVFVERGFPYDDRIRAVQPGTVLAGYFQSWRYFDACEAELRSRLTTLDRPTDWYTSMTAALAAEGDWIGVHIRMGDYLHPKVSRKHGNVTQPYVERAVGTLERLGHDGRIVLFSDHPDQARQLSTRLHDAVLLEPPASSHPIESINLMAQSSALVMSNSSFSWWGGYLGHRPGRSVVAPRPWFGDITSDTRDLLLPDWLTVERRSFA